MSDPTNDKSAHGKAEFDRANEAGATTSATDDSSAGLGNQAGDLDQSADAKKEREGSGTEPSLQEHHDPETEADTASGGTPDE